MGKDRTPARGAGQSVAHSAILGPNIQVGGSFTGNLLVGMDRQLALADPSAATAYQAQLVDIAPDQLLGRETELDELVQFCVGEAPYLWWQAWHWAGKSALLSWFALHPPVGVNVVSFFITKRYVGQSDSEAFTEAVLVQLAALCGEHAGPLLQTRARAGHLLRLLNSAAEQARADGRRLLLVVDGLDEDTSAGSGKPSVASLLPRRPPPEVRVLVASRPQPDLPDDVPVNHPLREMNQRRELTPSPYAQNVEHAAKHELKGLLAGPPLHRDVLGIITASGGGLTLTDLEQLTGEPPFELEPLLFGRSMRSRAPAWVLTREAERVYLFAHDTLRVTAVQQYGASLAGYRDRLHTWADGYRAHGWPRDTPMYLLRGYTEVLTTVGDTARLFALATDHHRHDWMLGLTGGDASALTEITSAFALVRRAATPDLGALLLLAFVRDELAHRNEQIPPRLPAVWITLGVPDRAAALADGISDSRARAQALALMIEAAFAVGDGVRAAALTEKAERLVPAIADFAHDQTRVELMRAVAACGDYDRAEKLGHGITVLSRDKSLAELVAVVAAAGKHIRAEQLIDKIADHQWKARALAKLVPVVAATGNRDRAAALADTAHRLIAHITDPWSLSVGEAQASYIWVLIELVAATAATGDRARAVALADTVENLARDIDHAITDREWHARVLAGLARVVAAAGDPDRAAVLVDTAQRLALQINEGWARDRALTKLVRVVASAGNHNLAVQLVGKITELDSQAAAVAKLVPVVAAARDRDSEATLADIAADLSSRMTNSRSSTPPELRSRVLAELAATAAAAGDRDRAAELADTAEHVARKITDPMRHTRVLAELARAVAAAGDRDRAAALADAVQHLTGEGTRQRWRRVPVEVIAAFAAVGDYDRAEDLLSQMEDVEMHELALAELASVAAANGHYDRAEQLAARAERWSRPRILASLISVVAANGDYDRAERLTSDIAVPSLRAQTLAALARAVSAGGHLHRAAVIVDRAEPLIDDIPEPVLKVKALAQLASAVAAAADQKRAAALASTAARLTHGITDPEMRALALVSLLPVVAAAGRGDLPGTLADASESLILKITDPARRAGVQAELVHAAATTEDHHRAERIAREITDEKIRTQALADLAAVRFETTAEDQRETSTRTGASSSLDLLGEAIDSTKWPAVLAVVGKVDPAALYRLSDALTKTTSS